MAYVPQSGSTVAFQSDPTKLVGTVSVVGNMNSSVQVLGTVATNNTSVITVGQGSIATVIIGGSIAASFTPPANQSVSGTVGASIIGLPPVSVSNFPTTQNVSGSVINFQGTSPWIVAPNNSSMVVIAQGSVAVAIISGSIAATFTPPANQSVSGTVQVQLLSTNASVITVGTAAANQSVSGTVGASIIGLPPVKLSDGTEILDFYEENQIDASTVGIAHMFKSNISSSIMSVVSPANPLPVSVQGTVNIGTIPGSVVAFQGGTQITSLVSTVPSSVIVGSSIFGQLPAGTAMLGSIAAYQGAIPWTITSIYGNISGSVVAFQGTSPWVIQSIVGTYSEDIPSTGADKGLFTLGIRNDTVASLVGNDLDYTGWSTDSAGRHLTKPFAADEATFRYNGSVVSGSVTLIQASTIGKRSYVTDILVSNTGSVFSLITLQGGDTSIVGYVPAPPTGGAVPIGLNVPMRTTLSQDLAFKSGTANSILYITVNGYQAP